MSDVLKGNFTPRRPVSANPGPPDLEQLFEREALKRLGGSIAFVSRKGLIWTGEADESKKKE